MERGLPAGSGKVAASLAPNHKRVLVRWKSDDPDDGLKIYAMQFDVATGDRAGMPLANGEVDKKYWAFGLGVGWEGWGCRPAWHSGLPVITDRQISASHERDPKITVSNRFDLRCASFAGDRIEGQAASNRLRVVQAWLWYPGLPGLLLATFAGAVALFGWRSMRSR